MKLKAFLLFIFITGKLVAQSTSGQAEIQIKTSAQCEMCKNRIEEALAFEKGVKKANLDMETKVVTVVYKTSKTEPSKLRKAISKAGYDADDIKADQEAYNKLPACCKKPDDPDHKIH
jgi:copper chaperone CopZ